MVSTEAVHGKFKLHFRVAGDRYARCVLTQESFVSVIKLKVRVAIVDSLDRGVFVDTFTRASDGQRYFCTIFTMEKNLFLRQMRKAETEFKVKCSINFLENNKCDMAVKSPSPSIICCDDDRDGERNDTPVQEHHEEHDGDDEETDDDPDVGDYATKSQLAAAMMKRFRPLWLNGRYSHVNLVAGDERIAAHCVVLHAASPVFEAMFQFRLVALIPAQKWWL